MREYGLNELRNSFLDFFESKGHIVAPSFSLVPKDDPSLLLINSGMAPLKPYFTGAKEPPGRRMATCQKCIRTPDIENVGKTARHGTFFEMLGNFSFGDYFKKEAIIWAWEYFTEVLKLDRSLLYVSVYEEDKEAYGIWKNIVGLDQERIVKLGKKDNFWEHGLGPCGPCSELYFDRGERYGCGSSECAPGCDCDRFIEVWNLVFTQFDKDEQGNYHPLPNPNIDTGMGLERLAVVCQGARNMFEVDTIKGIIDRICELTGKIYGADEKDDISIRVITDHIRGITHMISDGIMPSNEGRGYVLRRLLRRAARHGRLLGSGYSFLKILSEKAIEVSSTAYPDLLLKQEHICRVVGTESDKFDRTLDSGLEVLKEMIADTNGDTISGADVFKLHDTFGFPIDLTREIAWENQKKIDENGFLELMAIQKEKAREAFKSKNIAWSKDDGKGIILQGLKNEFLGYDVLEIDAVLLKLFSDQKEISQAEAGDVINAVFEKTPFYAQSGGQTADKGWIRGDGFRAAVIDVKKYEELHIHVLEIEEGSISTGETYSLIVDKEERKATMRNHTATHILHKALCDEIGAHVEQKGSYVDAFRLRFDFSHFQPVDRKILDKIEKKANSIIFSALQVKTEVMKLQQAKEKKAKALFDEKYADDVRVVSVGDYSSELCGGTHVSNSGQIGIIRILSETGVAAGVRRIEALTGFNAFDHLSGKERQLEELASIMKSPVEDAKTKLISILDNNRELSKQLDELKQEIAARELGSKDNKPMEINGLHIFSKLFTEMDAKTMRETADMIKERYPDSVILIGSVFQDKVSFMVSCSDKAVSRGLNAGEIIREVAKTAGGGGGGKATLAQAGGRDPLMADAAIKRGIEVIKDMLS